MAPDFQQQVERLACCFRNVAIQRNAAPEFIELSPRRVGAAVGEAVTRMPALITALEAAVRRLNHGTADAQAELLPALRDARAAAASLRDTSETLRRNPSSILLGAPPPRDRQ